LNSPGDDTRASLRRGDIVRVRSAAEILATLDHDGTLKSLPFMAEMLQYCGQELPVAARADKSCDTLDFTGNRRMENTVHLLGARCDGSAHGGCQASCNLFWREEWLERPDQPRPTANAPAGVALQILADFANPSGDDSVYRCQATEHGRASSPMPRHYYGQYVQDVRSRNVSVWVALRGLLIFVFNKYQRLTIRLLPPWLRIKAGRAFPFVVGQTSGERTPVTEFRPGELVEVRSKQEIMATLGPDQRAGNLFFDAEMLPYCGRRARVLRNRSEWLRRVEEPVSPAPAGHLSAG
jgi:hypothetical protein